MKVNLTEGKPTTSGEFARFYEALNYSEQYTDEEVKEMLFLNEPIEYKIVSQFVPYVCTVEVQPNGLPVVEEDEHGADKTLMDKAIEQIYLDGLETQGDNLWQKLNGRPHFMVMSNANLGTEDGEQLPFLTGEEFTTYAEAEDCIRRHKIFDRKLAVLRTGLFFIDTDEFLPDDGGAYDLADKMRLYAEGEKRLEKEAREAALKD